MENLNHTSKLFKEVQEMVQCCIQCGTCSGSCLAASVMEHTPRKIWRLVQLDLQEKVLSSKSFIYCTSCYYCTLRCPRGLPLTQAMAGLKEIVFKSTPQRHRGSMGFYKYFVKNVRRHGRVNEVELMTNYLVSTRNPLTALKYAPLGMKLMGKGKLSFGNAIKGKEVLMGLFQKVKEIESNI